MCCDLTSSLLEELCVLLTMESSSSPRFMNTVMATGVNTDILHFTSYAMTVLQCGVS